MGATARLFTYNRRRSDGIMLTLRVVITSSRPLLPDTIALCLRLHQIDRRGSPRIDAWEGAPFAACQRGKAVIYWQHQNI
jgi:hypothetical protein